MLLAALWMGLLWGGALGRSFAGIFVPLAVLGLVYPVFLSDRLRFVLLVTAFFIIGILRSPEAVWNRSALPRELSAASGLPVILKVTTPWLAAECSDQVSAEVNEVIVGPVVLAGRKVLLRGFEAITPPGRSRFTVCGKFGAPKARLNPFGMDMRKQYRRLGVVGAVDMTGIVEERGSGLVGKFSAFRERLESLILGCYPGDASGMLAAMLLGERQTVSPRVQTVMLRAGTYHVIAVSGLHVVIVLAVLSAFLSILGLPRNLLALIYAVAVVFYIMFTGNPPSAVRAGGLFLVATACKLLQWKVDLTNSACASGALLLLAFPYFAWDIGFQLSLGAVVGMTVLVPRLEASRDEGSSLINRAARYLYSGFIVCLAAQAFTMPVVLHDFGRASLVGPAGNLIMVPLTTLAIAAGIQGSFAALVSRKLALLFLKAAAFFTHVSIVGTEVITKSPYALIFSGRPGAVRTIIYCAGLGVLGFGLARIKKHTRLVLLLGLHALLIFPLPQRSATLLRLTFLYVGDGDALLIETPGGGTTLVDAGPNSEAYGQAQNQVLRYLAMRGIGKLDEVVVTHSHDDHYGGVGSLLENVRMGQIVVGTLKGEPDYEHLLERARRKGTKIRVARVGETWKVGGVGFEVLNSGDTLTAGRAERDEARVGAEGGTARAEGSRPDEGSTGANPQSVVLRVTFGEIGVMLTGDVTADVQREIAASAASLRCDVLKVPHHGARGFLDPEFLKRLSPRYAVISVGTKFASHPSPETVAELEASGVKVFKTSRDGAITVVTDGHWLRLKAEASD